MFRPYSSKNLSEDKSINALLEIEEGTVDSLSSSKSFNVSFKLRVFLASSSPASGASPITKSLTSKESITKLSKDSKLTRISISHSNPMP